MIVFRPRLAQLCQRASLLAIAGTALSCAAAWGQTLPGAASPPTTAADDSAGKVPEVVVTATRRSEKDQDVPVSTAVLTPGEITQIFDAGGDIRALAGQVPSLNIESSNGRTFPRLYIRGYGNTDFTSFASQPVSLVYDDVDQENPALKGFPIFDVADVEVLRGPQGTLFGRNAPAGVVNVQSAKPVLGQFSETFSASDGTYNTANFLGVLNAPINDQIAIRISAQDQHRDSWVTNEAPSPSTDHLEGYDDFGARIQLLYKPDSDFSALFNFHGRSLSASARLFRADIIEPGTDDLVPGFDPAKFYAAGKNVQTFSSVGGSARLMWTLGDVSIFSITGFEKIMNYFTEGDIDGGYFDQNGNGFPIATGKNGVTVTDLFPVETAGGISSHIQLTQEIRAQSNYSGPLNWQAGLYYFYEDVTAPNWDFDPTGTYVTDDNYSRQLNDAEAVFVSLDYKPIPRLELRTGARYTNDYKKFSVPSEFNQAYLLPLPEEKARGDNISWDVSATYTVVRDINLYSRVASGFRAPSFGAPSDGLGIQVAKAETNTSGEVGVKSFLFDRRVKFDFDLYYFQVKNQQLTAVGGDNDTTRLLNAKQTVGDGAELAFEWRLTPRLIFDLSASYNFTRIEDPTLATGVCAQCTVTNTTFTANGQTFAYLNGNPLPQAPKYVVDPALTYSYPLAMGNELFFSGNAAYRSTINFFLYESVEFRGQPYTNVGLRGGYRWNYGKYEIAAYCSNCLNQIRLVGGIDFDNLTGFINDPVIAGVQFTGKW